ncbi:hypothetical protein AB6D11_03165 [Vibrio splendidus]
MNIKLTSIALLSTILLSNTASAGMCLKPPTGMSQESQTKAQEEQDSNDDPFKMFMTCSGPLLMGSSPQDIVGEKCEDGSIPCLEAVKKFCKKDKKKIVKGVGGASRSMCLPFAFLF